MLAVGDSTRLEIIFSTKKYSSRINKSPRIQTNEGPPHKNVSITSLVVKRPDSTYPVVIRPYKLDISQFGEKVRDKMRFSINNVSDEDLTLDLIAVPTELAEIELPEKIKAGQSAEGVLTLRPEALDKAFEKSFTFEVDDDQFSRFTVPIKRQLQNPSAQTEAQTKSSSK